MIVGAARSRLVDMVVDSPHGAGRRGSFVMMGESHDRQKILIVDDEPLNIQVLERLLHKAGYRDLTSTTESRTAIGLYEESLPDLILLDLHMPMLDGFGVMAQLSERVAADDYVPILVLTSDLSRDTKQRALAGGAKDFLTKPFDPPEVLARVANLLDTRSLHLQLRTYNERLEEKVKERTADLWTAIKDLERAESDLHLAQAETIQRLSLAAEFRDDETSRHIERMSHYCAILAERLGDDRRRCELIRTASKMHDIGKIGVPDAVLLKPGKLTPEEFEVMKQHAEIGRQILKDSESELGKLGEVIAWTHHEKVDGTGYPRGLVGDDIPREGKIAAIADVFDALTTNRVYRSAFPLTEALAIMRDGRGKHFDPDMLDVFFDAIDVVLTMKGRFDDARAY